jgi:hypothetical protein
MQPDEKTDEPPQPLPPSREVPADERQALRRTRQYSDGLPPVDVTELPRRPERASRADTLLEGQAERAQLADAVPPSIPDDRTVTTQAAVAHDETLEPHEIAVLEDAPARPERQTAEVVGPRLEEVRLETVRAALEPVQAVKVRLPALSDGRPTPKELPVVRTRGDRPTAQHLPQVRTPPWRIAGAVVGLVTVGAVLAYVGIRALDRPVAHRESTHETPPAPILPQPKPVRVVTPEPNSPRQPEPPIAAILEPAQKAQPVQTPPPEVEPAQVPPWTHEVAGTAADPEAPFLALRTAATAGAELVAELPDGTHVRALGRSGRWLHVQVTDGPHAQQRGWVHVRWLTAR